MRQRLRPMRPRSMARRPDGERRIELSPRSRLIAGWVAALVIIGSIALAVRLLGGNADGAAVVPTDDATPSPGQAAEVRFGTALDPTTGEVAADAATNRFVESDRFVYSYRPAEPPPPTVWVEVRHGSDGSGEAVQAPALHRLAADALVIAFDVPASALFDDFGPGPFQMRIYLREDAEPAAIGSFELVTAQPSPTP
ncbi:MAG TPA: hypothetical protein VLA76_00980 [Candidatus Angelobacter sp.]|nr:hypothetical protein [Candidatus Angelobacter sp.]